jgi:hypothetical protein
MTRVSVRRLTPGLVVTLFPTAACSVASSGSGGLAAVSVGFSELIVEGALVLLALVGCAVLWNSRR